MATAIFLTRPVAPRSGVGDEQMYGGTGNQSGGLGDHADVGMGDPYGSPAPCNHQKNGGYVRS